MDKSKSPKRAWAPALAFLLLLLLAPAAPAPAQNQRLQVAVPVAPLGWLVHKLGGERVQIRVLIPTRADVQTYDLAGRALNLLKGAQIYFSLDMPNERRLATRLDDLSPRPQMVDATAGVSRLKGKFTPQMINLVRQSKRPHSPQRGSASLRTAEPLGGRAKPKHDPYLWLSPLRCQQMAQNMATALAVADPDGAARYRSGLAELQVELTGLDLELSDIFSPVRGGSFMVVNPAFGYLAKDYHLKQVSLSGQGPGGNKLSGLVELMDALGSKTIFTQLGYSRTMAKTLARHSKASLVLLNPLAPDLAANLKYMAEKIARSMPISKK